jgi:hypothetical protein
VSDKELEELRSEVAALRAELTVTSQNRQAILREKRELQDKLRELKGPPPDASAYTLTREEARDPQRYRAAREAALAAGLLNGPIFADPNEKALAATDGPKTIRTENAIYIQNEAAKDVRQYRRARDEAQRNGKTLRFYGDRASLAALADDDPDALAAFDKASAP